MVDAVVRIQLAGTCSGAGGTCYSLALLHAVLCHAVLCVLCCAVLSQGYILKCLISPDVQQLATASSDKTVKLWNVDGFSLDRTLTGMTYISIQEKKERYSIPPACWLAQVQGCWSILLITHVVTAVDPC